MLSRFMLFLRTICVATVVLVAGCALLGLSWDEAWENEGFVSWQGFGPPVSMATTADGGVVAVGMVGNPNLPGSQPFLISIDAQGKTDRTVTPEGRLECIRAVPAGGFVAAGSLNSKGWLLRLNDDLDQLWSVTCEDSTSSFSAVCPTADGGFIAAGSTHGDSALLIKTDAVGRPLWQKSWAIGEHLGYLNGLAELPDGGAILSCTRTTLARVDCDGETAWTRDWGFNVGGPVLAADGNVFASGDAERVPGQGWYRDILVLGANIEGETLWTRRYQRAEDQSPASVAAASDGGCVVFGSTYYAQDRSRVLVLQYRVDGSLSSAHECGSAVSWACGGVATTDGWFVIASAEYHSLEEKSLVFLKTRP